jgi:hypothetical protein
MITSGNFDWTGGAWECTLLTECVSGFAGLRLLDGGADTSSVYHFARFYYLTAGLQYRM